MNLHGIVAPLIGAVNPFIPALVFISTGPSDPDPSGHRMPTYATPATFTASIAADVMTVVAISEGRILPGETISGTGVASGTQVVEQLTGEEGGVGTYRVGYAQTVTETTVIGILIVQAQIQPVGWRDLQQLEGLNLGGVRSKVYLSGALDAVRRVDNKGGDLILISSGARSNRGIWLVAMILEQFPDWVCAAITLQRTPASVINGQVDFSNPDNSALQVAIMTGV